MKKHIEFLGLTVLIVGAGLYLFGPSFFDKKAILFSNDGPLGVMNSDHMRHAATPGSPHWDDLHWLGANGGVMPASLSYLIIGMLYSPRMLAICIVSAALLFCIVKLIRGFMIIAEHSKKDYVNKKHL